MDNDTHIESLRIVFNGKSDDFTHRLAYHSHSRDLQVCVWSTIDIPKSGHPIRLSRFAIYFYGMCMLTFYIMTLVAERQSDRFKIHHKHVFSTNHRSNMKQDLQAKSSQLIV